MTFSEQGVTRREIKCKTFKKSSPPESSEILMASLVQCRPPLCKLKSICSDRMPRPDEVKSKCAHGWVWVIVSLLTLCLVLQFVDLPTRGHLLSAARIETRRISYFLGKSWRETTGISHPNYIYPGLVPPYVSNSTCEHSTPADTRSEKSRFASQSTTIGADFDICLALSIGDDGGQPRDKSLPYQLVYSRLFAAMKEEIYATRTHKGKSKAKEVQVLVGVDYGSIVCKMVRDFVNELEIGLPGVKAQCRSFDQLTDGTKCGKLISGSTHRFVPQISPDFNRMASWKSQRLVDLDCSRPEEDAPPIPESKWQPTIVTGFSSNHMAVGLLMLRSLGKAAKEGAVELGTGVSVVVWAMEVFKPEHQKILDCVIDELNTEYNVKAEVRLFDFSAHPQWMRLNQSLGYFGGTGEYAWKGIMVHTVLRERGIALWADAGDRFEDTVSLVETLNTLKSTGFVSRKSHGTIWTRTHPLHLKFFRANLPGIWDLENCEAAIVGFTLKKYKEIARPWYECALIRQCIAPDGSDRSNHRQDQAALSVLSILSRSPCEGAHQHFGHHMDDNPVDSEPVVTLGVYTTHCYVDPLRLSLEQGTHLDHGREGPYIWH